MPLVRLFKSPDLASSVFSRPRQGAGVCVIVVFKCIYICLSSWLVTQQGGSSVRSFGRWFPFPATCGPVPGEVFQVCPAQTQNLRRDYISPLVLECLGVGRAGGREGFTSDLAWIDMGQWIRETSGPQFWAVVDRCGGRA